MRNSRTSCCRRCASASAVTPSRAAERACMTEQRDADALVLFGATGDLCYRKIYPALYHLLRRGRLQTPVVGVARGGWSLEKLVEHVGASVREFVKQPDEKLIAQLGGLLAYVEGDYREMATFEKLRGALGSARLPV